MSNLINKLNVVKVNGRPEGWVVRVTYNEQGGVKSSDFGIYLEENVFMSVPLHYCVVDKLIPFNDFATSTERYFLLPNDLKLKLIKTKTKSEKVIPLLVPARDGSRGDFLACVTFVPANGQSVLDIETTGRVVRDVIPKNRKYIALIVLDDNAEVINPSVKISVTSGVIGSNKVTVRNIDMNTVAPTSSEDEIILDGEKAATKFIKFNRFLLTNAQLAKAVDTVAAEETVNIRPQRPQGGKFHNGKTGGKGRRNSNR